jgi:hypothetical protein
MAREAVWNRPDIAALRTAYEQAASGNTNDRLIGAILRHAIDAHGDAGRPLERRTIELAAGEPGFRAATAAEVQRRLSLNTALTGTQLEATAARSSDPRLASIAQLFRSLTGDSHVALDAVIDLPDDATPVECGEAIRRQVDAVIAAGGLAPDLVRYLQQVVTTIG